MSRRHDVRRIRQHRCYTVPQVTDLMDVNIRTVHTWIAEGLRPIDRSRPRLIHGSVLRAFLSARNKPRQPLDCGEIFCVACKAPRRPADDAVCFVARAPTNGDLVGTCPTCDRTIYRRVRRAELAEKLGGLVLTHEDGTDA